MHLAAWVDVAAISAERQSAPRRLTCFAPFHGASYLAGLNEIGKQKLSTTATVLTVIAFNLIMLMLLELPLFGYTFAPDWTPGAVERSKAWVGRHGKKAAAIAVAVLGGALIIRGAIELMS
jgi:Sap, sulfolipid-1-addressing protein